MIVSGIASTCQIPSLLTALRWHSLSGASSKAHIRIRVVFSVMMSLCLGDFTYVAHKIGPFRERDY